MSDPFARHGVKWLSPSSLNLFQGCPSFWIAKYLFQVKDEFGPAAARGTAVEAGLDHWLCSDLRRPGDAVDCGKIAEDNIALNTGGQCDDAHEAERALLRPMLAQACAALKNAPPPNARQIKIEYRFDGIEVPIIGYIDYVWDDWGLDLKTTTRCPSSPKPDHVRQVSVYSAAKSKPFKLLYATDKKSALYPVFQTEADSGLADMRRIALAMRKVLDKSEDRREAAEFYAPDYDAFYWKEETKRQAEDIWK